MAAYDAVPNTTLTSGITASQTIFKVTSAASILTTHLLVIEGEACEVSQVDTTTNIIQVRRGVAGTAAVPHGFNGAYPRVYYGPPASFQTIAQSAPGLLAPDAPCPIPGARATDRAGNVWVLVDLVTTVYDRCTVVINANDGYTGTIAAGGTANGPVGVTLNKGTSDQWVWAQVYGFCPNAQETVGDSAGTSAQIPVAATTPSTPSVGLALVAESTVGRYYINGMFVQGAATTLVSSATSSTGVGYPVFLDFPYVTFFRTDISSL